MIVIWENCGQINIFVEYYSTVGGCGTWSMCWQTIIWAKGTIFEVVVVGEGGELLDLGKMNMYFCENIIIMGVGKL